MKTLKYWMVVPTALVAILTCTGSTRAENVNLKPQFQPDPLEIAGTSGGSQQSSDCGNIAQTPNHIINLKEKFDYLRFTVQGDGQPTLLINGPNGRTCVPGLPGQEIEDSGLWVPGQYSIYIGDSAGGQHPYTLTITQQR